MVNYNVPRDALILAERSVGSGELVTTYYATPDGELYKVADWKWSRPVPTNPLEVCALCGDSFTTLQARIRLWLREREVFAELPLDRA